MISITKIFKWITKNFRKTLTMPNQINQRTKLIILKNQWLELKGQVKV